MFYDNFLCVHALAVGSLHDVKSCAEVMRRHLATSDVANLHYAEALISNNHATHYEERTLSLCCCIGDAGCLGASELLCVVHATLQGIGVEVAYECHDAHVVNVPSVLQFYRVGLLEVVLGDVEHVAPCRAAEHLAEHSVLHVAAARCAS